MRQRSLQERVLVAGRPFHQQQAARPAGRLHEHAAAVVLGGDLTGGHRHLDTVHRRHRRVGRHGEHGAHRRAVDDGHTPHVHRPAVRGERELERVRSEAGAHRRHLDVDRGIRQPGLTRRQPDDLAIAGDTRFAHADGEDGGRTGRRLLARRRGVAAVRQHDDAGERAAAVVIGHRGERALEVRPAGRGLHVAGRHTHGAVAERPGLAAGAPAPARRRSACCATRRPGWRRCDRGRRAGPPPAPAAAPPPRAAAAPGRATR